jgi:hypothetical protein
MDRRNAFFFCENNVFVTRPSDVLRKLHKHENYKNFQFESIVFGGQENFEFPKVEEISQNSQAQHKRQDKKGDIFLLINPPSCICPKT